VIVSVTFLLKCHVTLPTHLYLKTLLIKKCDWCFACKYLSPVSTSKYLSAMPLLGNYLIARKHECDVALGSTVYSPTPGYFLTTTTTYPQMSKIIHAISKCAVLTIKLCLSHYWNDPIHNLLVDLLLLSHPPIITSWDCPSRTTAVSVVYTGRVPMVIHVVAVELRV